MHQVPPTGPAPSLRETHLRDYWRVVWQSRYTVLTIFLLIVGVSVLRVALAEPIYQATAVLEIKPEAKRILPGQEQWVGAQGLGWIAEEKYFNTQLEVLKSRDVAQRAFRRLKLENHPSFAKLSDPIGAFAAKVQVRPKIETRLVTVSIRGTNPTEITEWVNTVADVYVQRNVDEAVASFHAIMDEIERGLGAFRTTLQEADKQKMQEAEAGDLFVPENQQEILRRNLQTYSDELARLKVEIGSLDAEIAGLEGKIREGKELLTLPRFAQDPEVRELIAQKLLVERDLERIRLEKKPRHPDYLAKQGDLDKVQQRIDEQIARIIEKLRTQLRLDRAQAGYLQAQIRGTEERAFHVQQASSSYELQKTDAETKRKVYDVVAETMNKLSVSAQLIGMNNNVAVLDRAIQPRVPVAPRKFLWLTVGSLLGLISAVGAVLFLDYFDNTVRTPEDVEQYLGLALLAVVPKYREVNSNAVREAFQSLRTSILFSSHNRERRILLFTSAAAQEGKSSTVELTARALASAGDRVVVVDCDLRRPTQHVHFGVSREPGLTNFLLDDGATSVDPYLKATDIPTLKVLTCGPIPPNPPELVGLTRFREMLADLRDRYDWVLVDSPPVASLADSVVLASMADMMALVIKHNQNDRELIRRSLKRLRDVNVNVIGAVLNTVDAGRASGYYADYYYYGREEGRSATQPRAAGSRAKTRSRGGDDKKIAL